MGRGNHTTAVTCCQAPSALLFGLILLHCSTIFSSTPAVLLLCPLRSSGNEQSQQHHLSIIAQQVKNKSQSTEILYATQCYPPREAMDSNTWLGISYTVMRPSSPILLLGHWTNAEPDICLRQHHPARTVKFCTTSSYVPYVL